MNKQILQIIEKIRKAANMLLQKLFTAGEDSCKNIFDALKEPEFGLSEAETSLEMLKIALCYQEVSRETLSFKDLLSLVKKSFVLKPDLRICVLKSKNENFLKLDIMACDDKNNVLFSSDTPWVQINIAQMEPDLMQIFAEKDLIVLK